MGEMSCVYPCGDCPCDTCQLNVEADFDIRRAIDAYCYNCEDCCYMIGSSPKSKYRKKEYGECGEYRNGAALKMQRK